jgi:hypothetical protein
MEWPTAIWTVLSAGIVLLIVWFWLRDQQLERLVSPIAHGDDNGRIAMRHWGPQSVILGSEL